MPHDSPAPGHPGSNNDHRPTDPEHALAGYRLSWASLETDPTGDELLLRLRPMGPADRLRPLRHGRTTTTADLIDAVERRIIQQTLDAHHADLSAAAAALQTDPAYLQSRREALG